MDNSYQQHEVESNFADEFELPGFDEENYGISSSVDDAIYEGMDDPGIWSSDIDNSGGGGSSGTPLTLSVCIAGTPTNITFLTIP